MKIYNKLVRDKIPEIILKNGQTCVTRALNEDEILTALNNKLQEELTEYLTSGDVEELADLEEILRAILDLKNIDYGDFEKIRQEKAVNRGAFKARILLESVSD